MIKKFSIVILIITFLLTGCKDLEEHNDLTNIETDINILNNNSTSNEEESLINNEEEKKKGDVINNMYLELSNETYKIFLYENETTKRLKSLLPITLNMKDLHGNEKYYYLNQDLPSESNVVNYIEAGEIMLFGTNCLVIFYESFSTSYEYTKIGYIEDFENLSNKFYEQEVEITFIVKY